MKVATIDIGTNSVLLLIAEIHNHQLVALQEESTITRLGQDVDHSRRLHPQAIERTISCLHRYAEAIRGHGVSQMDAVSTSATRDAQGVDDFLDSAERVLGVRPRIISGDTEARLSFQGALSGLDVQGPVMVYDVGGGSTEIVLGHVDQGRRWHIEASHSLDIGCVRLSERHIRSDPPAEVELTNLRTEAALLFGPMSLDAPARTLIGIGGTVTTLAAVHLGLASYDPTKIHGALLTTTQISRLASRLAQLPLAERQILPGMERKRADVIIAGAIIVEQILLSTKSPETRVSNRGLRWGLALDLIAPHV
ncbi:MAG TPA: Ppx/GppA phosphatase family protein [Polyangiaceae bacterium]|nr:MAG: Exopolyphosphatase [Deltaproteobacteria bacterium ADurb.Bin207]HNS96019.1 Ppx/GppA phosphatase family protein [Polyangiaceae bacterium]HNZ22338.1 Ppx/GppA phosphatase family protein [Polyangiaceae bacterium]HOD20872.1 Ppx/GppA phosphatase family protein [Polyangiaceae bacterium]HOE49090.1 Ppx/GppA phosphatase family protein [Polyangiaceae bacterium]